MDHHQCSKHLGRCLRFRFVRLQLNIHLTHCGHNNSNEDCDYLIELSSVFRNRITRHSNGIAQFPLWVMMTWSSQRYKPMSHCRQDASWTDFQVPTIVRRWLQLQRWSNRTEEEEEGALGWQSGHSTPTPNRKINNHSSWCHFTTLDEDYNANCKMPQTVADKHIPRTVRKAYVIWWGDECGASPVTRPQICAKKRRRWQSSDWFAQPKTHRKVDEDSKI